MLSPPGLRSVLWSLDYFPDSLSILNYCANSMIDILFNTDQNYSIFETWSWESCRIAKLNYWKQSNFWKPNKIFLRIFTWLISKKPRNFSTKNDLTNPNCSLNFDLLDPIVCELKAITMTILLTVVLKYLTILASISVNVWFLIMNVSF